MEEIISECPGLKIAIGHFGMVTKPDWKKQIMLARHKNVMIESGGITWLFNDEFYPFNGAIRAINEAADLVGFEKLMCIPTIRAQLQPSPTKCRTTL